MAEGSHPLSMFALQLISIFLHLLSNIFCILCISLSFLYSSQETPYTTFLHIVLLTADQNIRRSPSTGMGFLANIMVLIFLLTDKAFARNTAPIKVISHALISRPSMLLLHKVLAIHLIPLSSILFSAM